MIQNKNPMLDLIENQAFFYNKPTPTIGLWINLSEITEQMTIEALMVAKFPHISVEEIRCSNVEGIARFFYNPQLDKFNMWGWGRFMVGRVRHPEFESHLIECYFEKIGVRQIGEVVNAYCGEYSSDEDFAKQTIEEIYGYEMPEAIRDTFDYKAFTDKLMDDHLSFKGQYFRIIPEDNSHCII